MTPFPAVGRRSVFVVLASAVLLGAGAVAGGQLLWEDRFDGGGRDVVAAEVIVAEGNAFTSSGPARAGTVTLDMLVRAHDAESGEPLWQDRHDGEYRPGVR